MGEGDGGISLILLQYDSSAVEKGVLWRTGETASWGIEWVAQNPNVYRTIDKLQGSFKSKMQARSLSPFLFPHHCIKWGGHVGMGENPTKIKNMISTFA